MNREVIELLALTLIGVAVGYMVGVMINCEREDNGNKLGQIEYILANNGNSTKR